MTVAAATATTGGADAPPPLAQHIRRRIRWADAGALFALTAYMIVALLSGPSWREVVSALELTASVAAAATMLMVAHRLRRQDARLGRAWGVLGAAFAANAAGVALVTLGGATLQGHPLSVLTHLVYLAFYPLFLIGVLGLPRVALKREERLKLLLDTVLVVLAVTSVLWTLAVRPFLADLPPARLIVTLAYPVADLVLVWAVLVLAFRRQAPGGRVTACLAGSAILLVLADTGFSLHILFGRTELAPWVGSLFFASHLLAVLAAARQLVLREELRALPAAHPGERSLAVAWAALGCAWVVVIFTQLPEADLPAVAAVTVALGLVAARQVVAVGETRQLYRSLQQANESLEERVALRTLELGTANHELRRRLQELTVISAVSAIAVEANEEEALLERATEAIRSSLFPDNCGVLLLDPRRRELRHAQSFFCRIGELGRHEVIPLGSGITGSVAASGLPRRVADTTNEHDYLVVDPAMRSELCVPIKVGGRVLGVIDAESSRRDAFSASDELVLAALAGQIATALDRLRGEERLRRQLQRLAALRAVDLAISARRPLLETFDVCLAQAREQLGVDAAAILLIGRTDRRLRSAAGIGLPPGLPRTADAGGGCNAARAAAARQISTIADLRAVTDTCAQAAELLAAGFVATAAAPLLVHGEVAGVFEVYLRGELPEDPEWRDFLEALAGQAAIAADNRLLFEDIERSNRELAAAYDTTLEGWSRALELRDQETQGHTARVAAMAVALARAVGMAEEDVVHLRRGALLHDIGKMGMPDSILLKPGPLDEQEWALMRRHPELARGLLAPIPFLAPALDVPYGHHERWDGSGYPRGLAGEAIPLAARVFAVVDVWDALSNDRPYRAAWAPQRVLQYLRDEAGRTLDATVVEAFLRLLEREPA